MANVPQLRISLDKARRIAVNIAKLPELLRKAALDQTLIIGLGLICAPLLHLLLS